MQATIDPKHVVDSVRAEIEAARGTRIWTDYVNALKLISQVVFTRSSAFILELLQNAEDAGLGLTSKGEFDIEVNQQRIKITHNGEPFSASDVRALCGIQSSKKPERGTLGYLGIGFKSVFTATDSPEIYSNGFSFKFDRNCGEWDNPASVPWHIIPIWVDEPSEEIDPRRTTIIIPLRDSSQYERIATEVEKLKTDLYLFLKWIRRITFKNTVKGETAIIENLGETDGITRLRHNDEEQRFLFFRKTINGVPDSVKRDRLTQEYRANVNQREISIAFALDERGDIAPMEAGAMYGGVYSFIPLGEAKSGAKFPIQGDFLVQPGRDSINYEAPWNHWLLGEILELCKSALHDFAAHERWRFQFLPAFEFTKNPGLESYSKLFGPRLIEPLERVLKEEPLIPTASGGVAPLRNVVRLTESEEAAGALDAIVPRDDIAAVLSGEPRRCLAHPRVREGPDKSIKQVDRWDLLKNREYLEAKAASPDGPKWFRSLYKWLNAFPFMESYFHYKTRWQAKRYHEYEVVLTSDLKLKKGGEVSVLDLPSSASVLAEFAAELQDVRAMLHPEILADEIAGDRDKNLENFLKGFMGVQALDTRAVCREAILPRITVASPVPSIDDLVRFSRYTRQLLKTELGPGANIWVITKTGDVCRAFEVLLSRELHPEQDWETNQQYVTGLKFIDSVYFLGAADEQTLIAWREFFRAAGVKGAPDRGVEEFAMRYSQQKLGTQWANVRAVDSRNLGYDLEAEDGRGKRLQIEVKGFTHEGDVELSPNETQAADDYRESLYVCVVSGIPEQPAMFLVPNPALRGRKEKITVPATVWKSFRWEAQ